MSEIKGQLLGMLMVLILFALVGGVLYNSFKNTVSTVNDKIDSETSLIAEM